MSSTKSICVFCGASRTVSKAYLDAAASFGETLALHGLRLVYGGGATGMMGAVANGALARGGYVTGVFPAGLDHLEVAHDGLSEMVHVETMHERKRVMFERSEAVAVLPGGFGTLDEMFEILTWKLLRFHHKPVILFNHQGYWNPLLAMIDHIIAEGFAHAQTLRLYHVAETPDEISRIWDKL